jgi:hypothetical protein
MSNLPVLVNDYDSISSRLAELRAEREVVNEGAYQHRPVGDDVPMGVSRHPFSGEALPPYTDGVFAQSLIPKFQVGMEIYFEDDPLHIYLVLGFTSMEPDCVDQVRRWRRDNP